MDQELYGRKTTLDTLHTVANDSSKSRLAREQAKKAMHEINHQLKDQKLNSYRAKLIQATKAHDDRAAHQIEQQIRAYQKQDLETGR